MLFEKRQLLSNWSLVDDDGKSHALWDYRQKSHVILIIDPKALPETRRGWHQQIDAEQKQWVWLHVTVLIIAQAPADVPPGVYLIDRYGLFINMFPIEAWSVEELQKEYVYYEARHC